MGDRLNGRVAVVTGSGMGIGKVTAIAMAKEGAKVVTNNRRPGSTGAVTYGEAWFNTLKEEHREFVLKRGGELLGDAETTAKEIIDMGGQAAPFFGDVCDFEVARKLIQTAVDKFGKIDILVNNAGTYKHTMIWEMTEEDWKRVVDSHLSSSFNCIRHAVGLMKEQGWGRIINATSSAWLGSMDHSNYSTAKAGIVGLTRAVARDMYQYGVTCNAYAPTALTRGLVNLITRAKQMAEAGTPIGPKDMTQRIEAMPGPEGIAPFIVYLASDEASGITGSVFGVTGGHIALYSEPAEIRSIDKKEGLWTMDELIESVPKVLLEGYKSRAAR